MLTRQSMLRRTLVCRQIETLQIVGVVRRQAMLSCTFDEQTDVAQRGLTPAADLVCLVCESGDLPAALDDGADMNPAVYAPWDTFGSVEMLGLFGRDQVKHAPRASARARLQIGDPS